MPLPVSGAISFNAINVELGVAGTTQASLNQASYRTLADVPSGAISLSNFYGKANQFAFTISSNQTNANLRTLAVNAGWNQSSKVVATISGGITLGSNATGTPGLTVNGSFPGGVELINNGFIVGRGGNGGNGGNNSPGVGGATGGLALSVSTAITITNNGTIAGGGGGGGGGSGGSFDLYGTNALRGGGGGGGRSSTLSGSSGGTPNGGGGTQASAGAGGAGQPHQPYDGISGASGGNGGNWGAVGGGGSSSKFSGGGGGAAGGAITGNSNITYLATGTRLGSIT